MLDGQDAGLGHNAASHKDMANAIRALSMDAVQKANSGHPGMPMGMADVATVLFTQFLKYDAADPVWPDRDRFVLSAGHGSMLLYSLLFLTGGPGITMENIKNFRQLHSCTAGHPEYRYIPGIETTTGPLGQGITTAVGMAIAERLMNARFGDGLVDHMTYVIAGDGCLMEGISHEAIDLAGHLKLSKLCVLWDDNSISIDGATSLSTSMDQGERFMAAGWNVMRVDGHNPAEIAAALAKARGSDKPTFIGCKTIIGYGSPNKQGTAATHGAPLGNDEIAATRAALGWASAPFELPEGVLASWRAAGERGRQAHDDWNARKAALSADQAKRFDDLLMGAIPARVTDDLAAFKRDMIEKKPKLATRKSSEMVLQVINDATEATVGGSADLTHSNYTITKGMKPVTPGDFSGRYIHYGIREHGMSAAMNGIALHGGAIPYGGTFLVFSDYARGAIRLSAIMGVRVLYVLTHDSIGVGEDGPTHQPIEHLAMLRATPNLLVFRPCDPVETAECYELALQSDRAPSVLAFSRQNVAAVRLEASDENLSAKGAYVLREASGRRDVTLIATGSEVDMTCQAAEALAAQGIHAAVVSMPCWELFEAQSDGYQSATLGDAPRVCIEAAARFGWDRWMGPKGTFIGMNGFGESGPGDEVYAHFGITKDAIIAAAKTAAGRDEPMDTIAPKKPAYKGIDGADVAGKRVLVRADLNVPMKDGAVSDATRIERLIPTIDALTKAGAKVVVMSHFGRPDGEKKPEFTLRPVAAKLEAILGKPVAFIEDTIGDGAKAGIARLANGQVAVLENLRFHKGEEKNDAEFSRELASLGDVYVNDAFSVSHRAHASTHGIAKVLPALAGHQMRDELTALSMALDAPKRPVVAIVGGSKVSTKIPVLTHLVDKVDVLIIGGGMANTFLYANGVSVGKSLCEPDFATTVKDIYARAEKSGCRIVLPLDAAVAKEFKAGAAHEIVEIGHVPADGLILDIGPQSIAEMSGILRDCQTLLWNGPVGVFEMPPFDTGTLALAELAAQLTKETGLVTVAGGGDTVAALNAAGVTHKFTYVSTAGGAFLEWMEGRELPGVAVLSAA